MIEMYLLDTDILSEFFKGNAKIDAKIESLPEDTQLTISIVNLIEILKGRFEFL
jgi:predicted nucleic acid-binding protein